MRIAMLAPGLRPHDAVSNDCLQMVEVLRSNGHDVTLFAWHAERIEEPVSDPATLEAWVRSPRDVVIYHYCTGVDAAVGLMRRVRARRVVRYHNITPPGFFRGWSPGYVAACETGRAEIAKFARMQCDLYLGDSAYNNDDFIDAGVDPSRCAVVPPFHECERLLAQEPDYGRIPKVAGAPLLLMVGRIAPNKGYLELVDALAACRTAVAEEAHLLVFGKLDPNLASYGEAFHARIDEHGLRKNVTIIGDGGDAELRAGFAAATALVMLSAHEGFCVPVVEALALSTPVIAYASSAIPGTLGDAGLLWESRDPALVAAAVGRVHADKDLRAFLRERGRHRYDSVFAPDVLQRGLLDALSRFA